MRLLACVSQHGRGHLAQSAPVLNALHAIRPGLEVVVRSALPHDVLAERLHFPFMHLKEPVDCGFEMLDAIRLDRAGSLAAYRRFHADWRARVEGEAEFLRHARIDRVFSNVAYLPLAAARRTGLPSAALCSLNWLDIFHHYLGDSPDAASIEAQIAEAYRSADVFLRPEPSMPMAWLAHGEGVPPVVLPGRPRKSEIRARLGLGGDMRLVIVGMGGIEYRLSHPVKFDEDGWIWLVPDNWGSLPGRVHRFCEARLPFMDLLASCDALITKPGYGAFVEAAALGMPVLYLPRADWPETPWLTAWLHAHARAQQIEETALQSGRVLADLDRLWRMPAPPAIATDGARVAARRLLDLFD